MRPPAGSNCPSGVRPRVEPVGQRDRARRRHAGLHQRQWRCSCRPPPALAAAVARRGHLQLRGSGQDAHRVRSSQGRDRQRHQCLRRPGPRRADQRHGDAESRTARLPMFPTPERTSDSFTYCANGTVTAGVCSSGVTATVTLGAATDRGRQRHHLHRHRPTRRHVATSLSIKTPGRPGGLQGRGGLPAHRVATATLQR